MLPERYYALTGWHCPANGGPCKKELNEKQKQLDISAREQISQELGHERIQVVTIYRRQ